MADDQIPSIDNSANNSAQFPAAGDGSRPAGAGLETGATSRFKGPMAKVLGVIGALVTSVLTAFGVKYSERIINPTHPADQPVKVVIAAPTHPLPTPTATLAKPAPPDPTKLYTCGPPIELFNGKDLQGFYSILGDPKDLRTEIAPPNPLGKNNDPLQVFSVRDGMLRVSGEVIGALLTNQEHGDYLLTAVYRWGEQTWPPRVDNARSSGVLLHAVGPDDAFRELFPQCIRCRIHEGLTGGFRLFNSKPPLQRLTVQCDERIGGGPKRGSVGFYRPGGTAKVFVGGNVHPAGVPPHFVDQKGWYASDSPEKPAGQWNTLECYCFGNTITIRLNGTVVNHATHSAQTKGKIGLHSFKAEIFFRNLQLRPLTRK